MRKHGKSPESTQKLRNFNALKSKTDSYPQATKSVIVGNPFASVSGDDAMNNARSKRIGRTTGKSADRFIRHEHLRQAQTPVDKQEISVAAKPVERIFWDSELPGFGVRAYRSRNLDQTYRRFR